MEGGEKMASNNGLRTRHHCRSMLLLMLLCIIIATQLHLFFRTQNALDCLIVDDAVSIANRGVNGKGRPITTSSTSLRSHLISSSKPVSSTNSISVITNTSGAKSEIDSMSLQTQPPRLIFTACCWCEQHEIWPHCAAKDSFVSYAIEKIRERGIDATFIQMPCKEKSIGPDLFTQQQEWAAYSAELIAAHTRGDVIAVPQHARVTPKTRESLCCLPSEDSNLWVEHALSGGNNTHINGIRHLQDKYQLHDIFDSIGLSDLMPKRYSMQEIHDRAFDFPLMVKSRYGTYGLGTTIVHGELELVGELKQRKDPLFEEVLTGERQITIHYMTRSSGAGGNGKMAAFWCGYYEKQDWKDRNGLFVLGQNDTYPSIKRIECSPKHTEAFQRVLQYTNLYGNVGCIDGKETDGPGTLKIFDWNARMCWGTPFQNIKIWSKLLLELKEQTV